MNDEFFYRTGVKTICVNLDNTKSDNKKIWNTVIFTDNLMDLMKVISEDKTFAREL